METFKNDINNQNNWANLGAYAIITTMAALTISSIYLSYNSELTYQGLNNHAFGFIDLHNLC